jgi:hypothetical protein
LLREKVRKLRVREVVPRTEFPNFRDCGKSVEPSLLRLLENLQKNHGRAFVSEAGLRRMIAEDTKHMPGVDTVPTALERFEHRGLIAQEWLLAGGIMPDGDQCKKGTRLIVVARNRHQRFVFRARAKHRNRRHGITNRIEGTFDEVRRKIDAALERAPDPREHEEEMARKRQEDGERLAELAAQWAAAESETPERPPP